MNIKKYFTLVVILIIGLTFLTAQSSNYSSYGIGIEQRASSTRMEGLGFSGSALYDSLSVTSYNPALWYGFRTVSLQGKVQYSNVKASKVSNEIEMGNFEGFSIKMPLTQYGGFVLGLKPSTRANSEVLDDKTGSKVKIKGGISELYFGGGYRLTKYLSGGLVSRFLFGKYSYLTNTETSYSKYYFSQHQNIRGNILGMGLFWRKPRNYSISFQYNHPVKVSHSKIIEYNRSTKSGEQNLKNDTTGYSSLDYPKNIKIGLSKHITKRISVTSDLNYSEKMDTEFQIPAEKDFDYTGSYLIGMGMERKPSRRFNAGFLDKLYYRVGAFYENGNIKSKAGKGRIEKGVSAGIGIPFYSGMSRLDISLLYSETSGFLDESIGKEKKLSINVELTSGGVWFSNALKY